MSYESWLISYQSSEQEVRSLYKEYNKILDKLAWEIYCRETTGSAHVLDFWEDLADNVKNMYRTKALENT